MHTDIGLVEKTVEKPPHITFLRPTTLSLVICKYIQTTELLKSQEKNKKNLTTPMAFKANNNYSPPQKTKSFFKLPFLYLNYSQSDNR